MRALAAHISRWLHYDNIVNETMNTCSHDCVCASNAFSAPVPVVRDNIIVRVYNVDGTL